VCVCSLETEGNAKRSATHLQEFAGGHHLARFGCKQDSQTDAQTRGCAAVVGFRNLTGDVNSGQTFLSDLTHHFASEDIPGVNFGRRAQQGIGVIEKRPGDFSIEVGLPPALRPECVEDGECRGAEVCEFDAVPLDRLGLRLNEWQRRREECGDVLNCIRFCGDRNQKAAGYCTIGWSVDYGTNEGG
jgi:hypothetical protein